MKLQLLCISCLSALLTIMIACHKDEVAATTNNPAPPPPPPPVVNATGCWNGSRPAIIAQLVPVGKLSQASSGMAVVAVGNKILFAGAWEKNDNSHGSSRVDIYDITTHTWSIAELSQPRYHIAAVAAGNKAFFAGGAWSDRVNYSAYAIVDIYDATTNTWTVDSLSEPRANMAAAEVGGKVFFAGGVGSKPLTSSTVDVYDLSTRTWSVTHLSADRYNMSAVSINNKIYFAGGFRMLAGWQEEVSGNIDIYDYASNSWSTASLVRPMQSVTGVGVDNKIYWASNCDVEIKDIQTGLSDEAFLYRGGTWNSSEGQCAVVKDNKIIFYRHNMETATQFDIYDIATEKWYVGEAPIEVLSTSIISVNNTIYLAGGRINGALTDQVWRLEF